MSVDPITLLGRATSPLRRRLAYAALWVIGLIATGAIPAIAGVQTPPGCTTLEAGEPAEPNPECYLIADRSNGAPGERVHVDGRCPQGLLHHRFAYIAFDCTTVAAWDFPGGDAPLDRTITVPRCATPGRHVLQLLGPFVAPGDVHVEFDVSDEAPPCAGDCDHDGRVSVAELVTGVGIALGSIPLAACVAFDGDGLGAVSVDELTLGATTALRGCSFTGCGER